MFPADSKAGDCLTCEVPVLTNASPSPLQKEFQMNFSRGTSGEMRRERGEHFPTISAVIKPPSASEVSAYPSPDPESPPQQLYVTQSANIGGWGHIWRYDGMMGQLVWGGNY